MTIRVVTGTGTEVGKTVVTAALAATALARGQRVAVLKAAQTGLAPGEPGDAAEVRRLAGETVTCEELARYPEPLAPDTAARRAGAPPVGPAQVAEAARELERRHDLVLIEGAGGLLVRLDARGGTLAEVAELLDAPVVVVVAAGLGTLNHTALTVEALEHRRLRCAGLVVGSWPSAPDLAARCNLDDLPTVTGQPVRGVLPAGAAALSPERFRGDAPGWLSPDWGGTWSPTTPAPTAS
ncbi:dethiobiotin synthase [Streptomyces sp. NPDC005438]|uniref:dethiobiotin synthase n=1 Tax=Streptomyces sp. NPDC005438 TaxID=3156880 RepID=UPI0033B81222